MDDPQRIEELMQEAIGLAWKYEAGIYRPYVGALILSSDGEIISRWTKKIVPGTRSMCIHAERDALFNLGEKARGGVLVTTLEPCVRIPLRSQIFSSCVELIVQSGISQVIIGLKDRADSVNGRGIHYLQDNGIQVQLYGGPLQSELQRIYRFAPSPSSSSLSMK